jgi:hypothetical protein
MPWPGVRAPPSFVPNRGGREGTGRGAGERDLARERGRKAFRRRPQSGARRERSHLLRKDVDLDTHIADVVNLIKWESLEDICLVVHSYGGWIGSGSLEAIGNRVSSTIWLDAFVPGDGQKVLDFTTRPHGGSPPWANPDPAHRKRNRRDNAIVLESPGR